MPQAAYSIVGIVGVALLAETILHIHIDEIKKFIVVLFIVLFTVLYEHFVIVRTLSNPILKKLQYLIAIPLDMYYSIKDAFKSVPTN
jgi:predicted tellurium resistance membrane protein TerC